MIGTLPYPSDKAPARGSPGWAAWKTAMRIRLSGEQNHRCCYCGVRMEERRAFKRGERCPNVITTEHLVRVIDGGSDDWGNLAAACGQCNSQREDRPPICWFVFVQARLLATPRRPDWLPALTRRAPKPLLPNPQTERHREILRQTAALYRTEP